jgi:hypothetical protein
MAEAAAGAIDKEMAALSPLQAPPLLIAERIRQF